MPQVVKRALVAFCASDDCRTCLTVTTAKREEILAYKKDSERPYEKTRLVVPGKFGYK